MQEASSSNGSINNRDDSDATMPPSKEAEAFWSSSPEDPEEFFYNPANATIIVKFANMQQCQMHLMQISTQLAQIPMQRYCIYTDVLNAKYSNSPYSPTVSNAFPMATSVPQ